MNRFYPLIFLILVPLHVLADTQQTVTASSPQNRVALLELYTSEGCSSCPPAEKWLSDLKQSGISDEQLIPIAFHVTYWDYIGWQDRFASQRYDQRQRNIALQNSQRTIYTPQFVLGGKDYRTYDQFNSDVRKIVAQKSQVDLELSAAHSDKNHLNVKLVADINRSKVKEIALFLSVYENNLSSDVENGENEGETLHHDYVVRKLEGPFIQSMPRGVAQHQKEVILEKEWVRDNLFIVAFAQNPHTGEILQAVRLQLE